MSFEVLVRDRLLYAAQVEQAPVALSFPNRTITCRQLICERVARQVEINNRGPDGQTAGAGANAALAPQVGALPRRRPRNKGKPAPIALLDAGEQSRRALEAFEQNGFIVLVDGRQVCRLDERIEVNPGMQVVFLRLAALVGG